MTGFPRLAGSYALNELGDNLGVIALAVLVLDETGSALATAALFLAAKFAPALVAPVLTARLDRSPPGRVLALLYAAEALAFVALALVASGAFSLPVVLALAALDGALALTARAVSRATVAALLRPAGLLREGNATINVAFAVTGVLGPIFGGVLVAASSPATALWLDAASFAAVGLLIGTARQLPTPEHDGQLSIRARLTAGLAFVASRPDLRTLIVTESVAFVFLFLIVPIEVVYAKRTLGAGDAGYGALLAAWGVGLLLGSALFARLRGRRVGPVVVAATSVIGVAYLAMAAAPGIVLACGAAVVGGVGNGVQWVSVLTAVQERVEDAFQARVVGLLESVGAAAPGIGFVLGGVLAALWSPRTAFAVAGAGVLMVAFAMARRLD